MLKIYYYYSLIVKLLKNVNVKSNGDIQKDCYEYFTSIDGIARQYESREVKEGKKRGECFVSVIGGWR